MVIGTLTMKCDWNVEDVSANDSSNPSPAKLQRLIKDTSSYNHNSFLDSLAGLQSNGIEIEY